MTSGEVALYRYERKKGGLLRDRVFLAMILSLTGFLSFYASWTEGYANTYYAAAVKSMLESFHNFFFASFDPGGYVSVDKPPLALWIQSLSATVFGFHGWSLILPQAIAAVISAALVYHLVQRRFGRPAGLVSALIFSITPIVAAVSRTNNFDSVVVLLVLLAAWALIVAAEKGNVWLLFLSVALVGLGFNVKMLQAFAVLPAFYVVYLLSPVQKTSKKLLHLCIATVLVLAISFSWATVVDLTPADQRPYVGSSQTNSVLELALGYNGIQRILPSGSPMGMARDAGVRMPGGASEGMPLTPPQGSIPGGIPGGTPPNAGNITGMQGPFPGGFGGFGGPGGEGGAAGIFRLLNQQMAGQISWLLPLSLIGLASALALTWKRKDGDRRAKLMSIVLWGLWLLPMIVYFSEAGFFHRYYLVMMAPAIAALCGIGLTAMWNEYRGGGRLWYLLPASLMATVLTESLIISRYPDLSYWLIPAIGIPGLACAAALAFTHYRISLGHLSKPIVMLGVVLLLIVPAYWSLTPILYGSQSQLPYAGPELAQQGRMPGMGPMDDNTGLINFLLNNTGTDRFIVAVPNAMSASNMIIETGKPVMAVGGFLGSDPILTTDKLARMVGDGEIRYYLLTDFQGPPRSGNMSANATGFVPLFGGMPGGQDSISEWVKAHGTLVPSDEWEDIQADVPSNSTGFGFERGGMELYDLEG